jgi:hypothetical protein
MVTKVVPALTVMEVCEEAMLVIKLPTMKKKIENRFFKNIEFIPSPPGGSSPIETGCDRFLSILIFSLLDMFQRL